MKYLIILGDGMSDEGNRTPLELADKPYIDALVAYSELGLVRTVADGLTPGSDVANLSVLGYDPKTYYTGRAPIEAASMGIDLSKTDLAVRCNLVTLSDDSFEQKRMLDYSAGEISTSEALELIDYLNQRLFCEYSEVNLYGGVSYRHCAVFKNANTPTVYHAPHDFTGESISSHLPSGALKELILELTKRSAELLQSHKINNARRARGQNPANSVWFWGEGTRPSLQSFKDKYGLSGAMISAVDLLKGIAVLTGMRVIGDPSFTGTIDTNYELKARLALQALEECDFVYVHVEASDECGHHGDYEGKTKSIGYLSSRIVQPIVEGLRAKGQDFSMLLLPDHATPHRLRKHTSTPVPYMLYRSGNDVINPNIAYTEAHAKGTGIFEPTGHNLIKKLFNS